MELVDSIDLAVTGTITHTFAAGYDYWIDISRFVTTNDIVIVLLRMNGASGGTDYTWASYNTLTDDDLGTDSGIQLGGASSFGSNTNEEAGPFHIRIGEFASASFYKRISWFGGYNGTSGNPIWVSGYGVWTDSAAVTSIELTVAGGFDSGVMTLYRSPRS